MEKINQIHPNEGLFERTQKSDAGIAKRALVRYLFPKHAEKSVRRHERLGSPIFRKIIMNTVGRMSKPFTGGNYRLDAHEGKMEAGADFAVRGSVFNETVHTLAALPLLVGVAVEATNGNLDHITHNKLLLALNLGCVAVQRYNRARIARMLDHQLTEGHEFEPGYENWLHIDSRLNAKPEQPTLDITDQSTVMQVINTQQETPNTAGTFQRLHQEF